MTAPAPAPSLTIGGRLLLPQPGGGFACLERGCLRIEHGRVAAVGTGGAVAADVHWPADHLLLPGFIDLHIHFPQTRVIAARGARLLDWLERYTFPAERAYGDPALCAARAGYFCDELLRHGTTSAVVYGSVHPESVEAVLGAAAARGMGLVAGKMLMDRGAPADLCDTVDTGYADTQALIARWHGRGRQRVAVTPRFALTSTEVQLAAAAALLRAHPGLHLQTHLAENSEEIAAVRAAFPWASDYTGVYERFGLLGPQSLFGHCVHLAEREWQALSDSGAVAVFCPSSNLFLGSGLFDLARCTDPRRPVRLGLGTDVGGGTSYSLLRTAADADKVLRLQGQGLSGTQALHLVTRGNAEALGLAHEIGTLAPGSFADLVVLDPRATPVMAHRLAGVHDLEEELFVLTTLGDDRAVRATYVEGRLVWDRDAAASR